MLLNRRKGAVREGDVGASVRTATNRGKESHAAPSGTTSGNRKKLKNRETKELCAGLLAEGDRETVVTVALKNRDRTRGKESGGRPQSAMGRENY